MKSYIKNNKAAWEEAYNHAPESYKNIVQRLKEQPESFISEFQKQHLDAKDINHKVIAQLLCNNGREILALGLMFQARQIIGFDIAENMVHDANQTAKELDVNASFYAMNVLEIPEKFYGTVDTIFIQIGAICWIKDLKELFWKVSKLLKQGGTFYLLDGHPITNMIGMEGEEGYDPKHPNQLIHSYFKETPYVDFQSAGYMTKESYESKVFTSFAHTFEGILMPMIESGLTIQSFYESNANLLENFPDLDGKGYPLVFFLKAIKQHQ